MKKTTLIFVFVLVCLVFSVFAEQNLGTFKQNSCISLVQICQNCTYNNISSVIYPNSTIAETNLTMVRTDTEYRRTFCNTSVLGSYLVYGFGDLDGLKTSWGYTFDITKTGENPTTIESVFYIGLLIVLVVFLIMAIIGVINNDGIEQIWIKYSFMSITYLLLIAITFVGWQMANAFIVSSFITEFLHTTWLILIYGFIPYIFLSFAYAFYQVLMIKQVMKWMSKGMTRDEAERRLHHGKK